MFHIKYKKTELMLQTDLLMFVQNVVKNVKLQEKTLQEMYKKCRRKCEILKGKTVILQFISGAPSAPSYQKMCLLNKILFFTVHF